MIEDKENKFLETGTKNIIIVGLGFVGSAMLVAVSMPENKENKPLYNVIGIDIDETKVNNVNAGILPVKSSDKNLETAFQKGIKAGNISATTDKNILKIADIVVVDINLDIQKKEKFNPYNYEFSYEIYQKAISDIAEKIFENTLVIIETTVPPGTTEKIVYPIFKDIFEERNLDINKLYLAHSYERVMPGADYLKSITDFYRVYAGINPKSSAKAREFLESFINTKDFPLCELENTTASETAKVLENSFRAMNIAFIQEWTEFADRAGINLFEIINTIRKRPTHKNIMLPGFGVDGYCLTKDSLLADWANINLFNGQKHLETSLNAIKINDEMPLYTIEKLKQEFNCLKNLNIAILGLSYIADVADTRYSPSETLYDFCLKEGANIFLHDSIADYWQEKNIKINTDINYFKNIKTDILIFTVKHKEYCELSASKIKDLFGNPKLIIDANNIINDETAFELKKNGIKLIGIGKGHWNE